MSIHKLYKKIGDVEQYVSSLILEFNRIPPESEFQAGYLSALRDLADELRINEENAVVETFAKQIEQVRQ